MRKLICYLAISLSAYSCGIEDLQDKLSNRDDTDTSEPRARKLNDGGTPNSSDGQQRERTAELTYRNSCMYELKKQKMFFYTLALIDTQIPTRLVTLPKNLTKNTQKT